MSDEDVRSGLKRRQFLGGAAMAGVASALTPRLAAAQTPAAPATAASSITMRTTEHFVGSAMNYAYAVKAGPFVFLNGCEAYDF